MLYALKYHIMVGIQVDLIIVFTALTSTDAIEDYRMKLFQQRIQRLVKLLLIIKKLLKSKKSQVLNSSLIKTISNNAQKLCV